MHSENCRTYKIKIGKESYTVNSPKITGSEILDLAGKTGERSVIYQKLKGGSRSVVALDQCVDLTEPGREKFVIIPCDQTEGYSGRCDFNLPAEDTLFLSAEGYRWESILEGGIRRIVISEFPLPEGYSSERVDLNVRLGANYPDEQIDMAYFFPPITRLDGKSIAATATDTFDGKVWQRWSRHRTPKNPWIPGQDDLSTHLVCVKDWLEKELSK